MLKKEAFANSLAILVVLVYVVLYIFNMFIPAVFDFLFNAQFFGADLAGEIPEISLGSFGGVLLALAVMSWVMGYTWAWLYNRMIKR